MRSPSAGRNRISSKPLEYPAAAYARYALPFGFLALAVFIAYNNIYGNQFVYDDDALIVQNASLRSWQHLPDLLLLAHQR